MGLCGLASAPVGTEEGGGEATSGENMSARMVTRWSGPAITCSCAIAMRADARALKRARRKPALLCARRLSTCRKEARTITIITIAAMMVSESTREKPERLILIGKLG